MSLHLVRSASNRTLWKACASRFLDEIGTGVGPVGSPSVLWVAHRAQRDSLLERAARRGLAGWLNPPIHFLSELPELFHVAGRPLGPLARRLLLSRLSAEAASRTGFPLGEARSTGPAAMLDALFGELLPEAIGPAELADALGAIAPDDFSRNRNRWIAATLRAYLEALETAGRFDPRAIHAIVAHRVEAGELGVAVSGAGRLHIYGLYSVRARRRLLRALARQDEVEVRVYLPPAGEEAEEWEELASSVERLPPAEDEEPGSWEVRPAPDAIREFRWVAGRVKRLLTDGAAEPHEIAVVARSGRQDTGRAYRALRDAGVPATARVRTPLSEIPALKATLELFRGAAEDWPYRPLRGVLGSPYLSIGVDLAGIDYIAETRRLSGLAAWVSELEHLKRRAGPEGDWELKRRGMRQDHLRRDLAAFRRFAKLVRPLAEARSERAWIEATLELLRGGPFRFRRRLCRPVEERWDVVRLDQRGVLQLESLLSEWAEHGASGDRLEPSEFHARLRHLLAGNELAHSTPAQKGVQILEAHEAVLTPFAHTFLIHANDGEFPRAPARGGVLSTEERVQLHEVGLPLTHADDAMRRERELWRAVTNGGAVTVTYRTMDARGTPRLPSLMVPPHDPTLELPRSLELDAEPVSPVQELRRAAHALVRHRRSGTGESVAVSDPARLRHAVLGAYAEARRGTALADPGEAARLGPSPWNGQIRDPAVLEDVRRLLGPEHLWSASKLQLYARCPFFFFMEHVLRLRKLEEAEEETTLLAWGGVAHTLLERFYGALEGGPPPSFDDRARSTLDRVSAEVFTELEEGDEWLGLPALWHLTRQEVLRSVADYLRWELERLAKTDARPHRLELSFGYPRREGIVELVGEDLSGTSRRMRVLGRIDRVDALGAPGQERFGILDYKRKRLPSPAGYRDGVLVQTPLYMKVVRDHYDLPIERGSFRSIMEAREQKPLQWGDPEFERALRIAFTIPERARAGLFEAIHAESEGWKDWYPGRDICRTEARLDSGSRFDG